MSEIHHFTSWSANCWVVSSVICPILTFAISYPLAASEGNIPKRGGAYFPSDSINEWPDRAIGTFGLGISAWCLSHLFYYHYLFLSERLPTWKKTNFAHLLWGELCTVFVFGVGAIQTGISPFWHSFCAYNAFIGLNIYIAISTWLMDSFIQHQDQKYRRGMLRVCSAVSSPIMFTLHMSPLTRGFSSSLAEIGLLASFLLWVASQYNVWGRVYIAYDGSLKCSVDFSLSKVISSRYQRMTIGEELSEGSIKITDGVEPSNTVEKWEDQLSKMNTNYCQHMKPRKM